MQKEEVTKELRELAESIEKGGSKLIDFGSFYIYANKNYGVIKLRLSDSIVVNIDLYDLYKGE